MSHPELAEAFAQYFISDQGFASIVEARRFAESVPGRTRATGNRSGEGGG